MNPIRLLLFAALFSFLFSQNAFSWNSPSISSPSDGSTVWTGITLDWNAVTGSHFYEVQFDTSNQYNSPVFQSHVKAYINSSGANNDTRHVCTDLLFGKLYYWRVRAWITNDTSAWTSRTFITRNDVNLTSPSNGATVWTGVTIDWGPHTGVSQYLWEVDTSMTFSSPEFKTGNKFYINSTDGNSDTRHAFGGELLFGVTYYWRIRAMNPVDTSGYSEVRSFITRNDITLTSPSNGATVWTGVTIDWAPHTGVSQYLWEVDTSMTFSSPEFKTGNKFYINSTDGNSDTRHAFGGELLFGATYFWRVRAMNPVDTSDYSEIRSFTTRNDITLTSPSNGATVWTGVTIDWAPHTGVSQYLWEVDTSMTFSSPEFKTGNKFYINSTDGNADTRHTFSGELLFGATYYWRIRAINPVDTSDYSEIRSFTTRSDLNLNSPANGSVGWTGVTINWAPHTGVSGYMWEVDTSNAFNSTVFQTGHTFYINSTDGNADTRFTFNNLLFGKTYYWRIRAWNQSDTSSYSEVRSFFTRDDVDLVSPADGAQNLNPSSVTMDWNAHHNIAYYEIQFDTTNLYNSQHFQSHSKAYINTVSSNSDTRHITPLMANQIYFWRVRPVNVTNAGVWTQRAFATGTIPIIYPGVPVLISPADSLQPAGPRVTLTWQSAANANQYEVQVSQNPGFFPADTFLLSGTSQSLGCLKRGATYFWKVRSYNGGVVSDWSETRHFTTAECDHPLNVTTTRLAPTTARLNWDTLSCASRYQIRGRAMGILNWVEINVNNPSTRFLDVSGLFNNITYEWQIRAICLPDNDTSAWSPLATFTTGCYPPDTNFTNPIISNAATLNWTRAWGTFGYEIRGRIVGATGATSLLIGGGATVSKNVFGLTPATNYEWRVRSFCTPDRLLASSWTPWVQFTTPGGARMEGTPFSEEQFIQVVPNPVEDYFRVTWSNPTNTSQKLIIRDLQGREVFVQEGISGQEITLHKGSLPSGMYLIELQGITPTKTKLVIK